ncbi:MAG: peptidyl-prolyl cis-trans isomerase [Pseudomonadota bacterium]
MTRFTGVFLVTLIVFGLAACEAPEAGAGDGRSVRVEGLTAATVNEEPIFLSDIELEAAAQGLVAPGEAFDPDHPDFQSVMDQMIDQKLLAQEAERRRLDATDGAAHRLQVARERILGNILVETLVANDVTEEAIQEMYAEQVRLQQLDDEVRVSLITVADQATAQTVIAEYDAGEEFPALAFKYSVDSTTRVDGGDLGYINPANQPEPFGSQIGDTPVGELSPPFEADSQWHVLKIEDRRQQAPKTLEEMRPDIVTFLTYSQINQTLKALRTSGEIEILERGRTATNGGDDG